MSRSFEYAHFAVPARRSELFRCENNWINFATVPVQRQFYGNLHHALAVEGHPRCAVSLLQIATGREGGAPASPTW
jgi:hypothetical protein